MIRNVFDNKNYAHHRTDGEKVKELNLNKIMRLGMVAFAALLLWQMVLSPIGIVAASQSCPTIDEKYAQIGGRNSFLGAPISGEKVAYDGIGHYRNYRGGFIYWKPQTCAHPISGPILQRWANLGWEKNLGYPITDIIKTRIGSYQRFEKGSIYYSPDTYAREAYGKTPAYIFRLEKFHIDNTRARHEDTDVASFTLRVGNQIFNPKIKHMGDVNNGDHTVGLEFGPIPITDDTPVLFNYQILNSGHGDSNTVDQVVTEGSKYLATTFIPISWAASGASYATGYLYKIFNANCDGPVAIDQISVTGATLKDWTSRISTYRISKFYPGTDSATGCGSNSKYTVTWSVTRV